MTALVAAPAVRQTLDVVAPDDVYLVSYPRSGSTWVRCVLTSLLLGQPVRPEVVERTIPDVHRADPSVRPASRPVLVKSHAPAFALPARLVYLVRDGRDALASYFHRQVALGRAPADGMTAFTTDPELWPCPWDEHVAGWLDAVAERPAGSSVVVRYEDLVDDPAGRFSRLAAWCGVPAGPSAIADALEWNRPERLRAIEDEAGTGSLNHVGSGRAGALDAATRELLEVRWRPVLARLGYLERSDA